MKNHEVNREFENCGQDSEVVVILNCGFKARFFAVDISDRAYIKRAKTLKYLEKRKIDEI